jgi:hypothetical protein
VSKKKPKDADKRVRRLEKIAADKGRPKKERRAAQAELDAIRGVFVPIEATGDDTAEPSSPSTDVDGPSTSPDASAPDDGGSADRVPPAHATFMGQPAQGRSGPLRAKQDAEVARQWAHHHATAKPVVERIADETVGVEEAPARADWRLEGPAVYVEEDIPEETDGEATGGPTAEEVASTPQEAVEVETEHGREFAVGAPTEWTEGTPSGIDHPENILEKPADPVLENGNGQPMIHYRDPQTGREKVKGYTRVTTYIDCLDDKTVLNAWKARVLLEGGAVELLQNDGTSPSLEAVARSVKRTDEALADIDRRTRVEGELLELRRQEVQREHRDVLARIGEDLLELGGAHEKANKGTDLHRLTELVDTGQPLPAGTTASDRRDIDAYQRAMTKLDAKVLWTERRVVLDDIQVSGTMDRALLVKLPGMGRRIRVVADVKTGNVTFAPGKIGMQLALYARGLGYDWTKPLERERLSLSTHHGLLIHLPQGEGRCSIYLVDLELANAGLGLARAVREWRNTAKRLFDIKSPIEAVA